MMIYYSQSRDGLHNSVDDMSVADPISFFPCFCPECVLYLTIIFLQIGLNKKKFFAFGWFEVPIVDALLSNNYWSQNLSYRDSCPWWLSWHFNCRHSQSGFGHISYCFENKASMFCSLFHRLTHRMHILVLKVGSWLTCAFVASTSGLACPPT